MSTRSSVSIRIRIRVTLAASWRFGFSLGLICTPLQELLSMYHTLWVSTYQQDIAFDPHILKPKIQMNWHSRRQLPQSVA